MASFDTQHADVIHDAQMDYYGKRLATCSSDRTIRVFDQARAGDKPVLRSELKGHEGPVWQVSWAHPRFGSVLASCGYDRKVFVWKEENGQWKIVYEFKGHELSVNSVAWAPHEYGLHLACCSSDGKVSVHSYDRGRWSVEIWPAHQVGANSVSWAPAIWENQAQGSTAPAILGGSGSANATLSPRRLASGGCDNVVRVWRLSGNGSWEQEDCLERHKAWVRDVAWAPNIGLPFQSIASCAQDGSVIVWTKEGSDEWVSADLVKFQEKKEVAWRVSWSIAGNVLAVSSGDNKVTLWKESLNHKDEWKIISQLDETGARQYAE